MTLAQRRRRRVELLIDQRLVGFLKPVMTISSGPGKSLPGKGRLTEIGRLQSQSETPEERAS